MSGETPHKRLGKYVVEGVLGEGGMGRVYRARDAELDRTVALKVLLERGDRKEVAAERLKREARAAAALNHPNVVSVYEVGEVDGTPFIAMEYVPGRSLVHAIRSNAVTLATRLSWLLDVARALDAAHDRGLVHRDVKPSNVIVRDDGVVKVVDFGVARSVDRPHSARPSKRAFDPTQVDLPTLTEPGALIGTVPYMAPEQVRGEPADARSDIFAWGVLAYELLTGKLPWRRTDTPSDIAAAVLLQPVERFESPITDIVLRALQKEPTERYASMHALIEALEPRVTAAPATTLPDPKVTDSFAGPLAHTASAHRTGPRRAIFAWVGSGTAAALVVGLVVLAVANRGAPHATDVAAAPAPDAAAPEPASSAAAPVVSSLASTDVTPVAPPATRAVAGSPRARPSRPEGKKTPAPRPSASTDPNGWLNQR